MTYVIAEPCVDVLDKACIEECPVDCIYEGQRMLYIHPDECVDCGECEPVCPVGAIFYEDDVPEQWKDYNKANLDFFDELGTPGGASKIGKVYRDPQLVANLPLPDDSGSGYDEEAWQKYLAANGSAWDGTAAAWPAFRKWFAYWAAERDLSVPATALLDYLESFPVPERIAEFRRYGVTIGQRT